MALVGRTISASAFGAGSTHRGPSVGSRTASANAADDVTQLYTLAEKAWMNMPTPADGSAALRPTEMAKMTDMLNQCWEEIRGWLEDHPSETDRQRAATHQGQFLTTALHMVCKLANPPADVLLSLLECAEETASWPDANGWLPLHHACANGSSGCALHALVEAYPEGKVHQDKRRRTPLHFAFFRKDAQESGAEGSRGVSILAEEGAGATDVNKDKGGGGDDEGEDEVGNSMEDIVRLLADSGAAELQDEGGMLPVHYASAYGTTSEVLEILLENYPESITKRENKGRNPLHLAMVNAHRKSSPKVVGFLLEKNAADIINAYDDDNHLPIHLLSMASKFPPEKVLERKNAADCLTLYLDAKPKATADFLTAIQTLPEWLRDIAVISDHIQDILNRKIVGRFPTMILILDIFFLILVIVLFEITTGQTIDHLFTKDDPDPVQRKPPADRDKVIAIIICGAYFLLREIVQITSLIVLGNPGAWLSDTGNWLDAAVICLIFSYAGIMLSTVPMVSNDSFRSGTAISKGILWMSVIMFLKSLYVEFSVFVNGVVYVLQRLLAFMIALVIFLVMFAQMFYILYAETEWCACTEEFPDANPFVHCDFWWSMMKVYTMLMGEIGNEGRYSTVPFAQILYYSFSFLCIILLGNVLIAIVTDSYGVIKNERAAMVFWANRLDFVAEMDAVKNIGKSIKRRFRPSDGMTDRPVGDFLKEEKKSVSLMRGGWRSIMTLFDPNLSYDLSPSSIEFWCYALVRFMAVVVLIPVWLILGLCTAGMLWPPQVREFLLKQKKAATSRADLAEQLAEQISDLKNEIKRLRADMKGEMKSDKKELAHVKAEVEAVQKEVMADLLQVKEIMVTLLDMSRDNLGKAN